jgi:DNA invertase Pin-like site-specific DNA recombinase
MFIRAYLRASTSEQDASRARADLEAFASERGMTIASWYVENESGAKLDRPELHRLLRDAHAEDVILCEQVDRLSRLKADDWQSLRAQIAAKRLRVVALDLPTSWQMVDGDEFTQRMADAINGMMLDMLAAIARKDYDDRRRRQAQGIAKAKARGVYRGRPEDTERLDRIGALLAEGKSWNAVIRLTGASRATVAKAAKRVEAKLPI